MRMGLGLGLTFTQPGSSDVGALVQSFLAGTDGFARDPADNTTVFTNSTGSTLASAAGAAGRWDTFWGKTPYNWQSSTAVTYDTTENDYASGHYALFSNLAWLNQATAVFVSERVVITSLAATNSLFAFSGGTVSTQGRVTFSVLTTGAVQLSCRRTDGESGASISSAAGVVSVGVPFTYSFEINPPAGTFRFWINGAVTSGNLQSTGASLAATNSLRARDGADLANTAANFLVGSKRRGVFVKNKLPTDAERAAIEAWVGGAGSNAIDNTAAAQPSIGSTVSLISTRHDTLDPGTQALGSQAYGPAGLYDQSRDKTIFAWLADPASTIVRVAELDHTTGVLSAPVTVATSPIDGDNHVQATVLKISDGRYVIFYGSHGSVQKWAVSNAANSIAAWTVQADLAAATYPKILDFPSGGGNGQIEFIYRDDPAQNLVRQPITYTSLGAFTPGSVTTLVSGNGGRVYAAGTVEKNGSNIEFTWTFSDGADTYRRNVYFGTYSPSGGTLASFDGAYSQAVPVTREMSDINYRLVHVGTEENTIPQFCRDASGNAHIAYARGNGVGNWDILHQMHDGTKWLPKSKIGTVYEYDAGSGFADGPAIVRIANGVAVLSPTGQVGGGFTSGGTHLRSMERVNGVWNAANIATASVGAISDAVPIRDGYLSSDDFVILSTETNNGVAFTKTPIYTVGTLATTWAAHT